MLAVTLDLAAARVIYPGGRFVGGHGQRQHAVQ